MKKIIFTIALAIFLVGFISAAVINVPADQATIQAAVNAAVSGDTINVAAGTYDEQVVIDGKNLTLQGVGDTTIIMPSSESILATFYTYPLGVLSGWEGLKLASPILVKNAQNVTVKTLKVDGINVDALPVGADRLAGIVYGEAGGLISNVTVNNIKTPGYTIRTYVIDVSSVTNPLNIEVEDSRVNDFARTAIQAQGANILANIHDNVVVGPGSIGPANVPNGIVLIANAKGNVTNNTISANHYTGVTFLGSGVLLYQAGTGILVSGNEIFDVDDAVLIAGTNFSNIENNNLHDNVKGVRIEQSTATDNIITGNLIVDNTLFGIDAGTSAGGNNVASENTITGNTIGVNNEAAFSFNATYNWWGDCTGPTYPTYNPPGTGDSIVNTTAPVLFSPWLGVCINLKADVACAEKSENVTLYAANVTSLSNTLPIDDVWFSYTFLNGTNRNKTALNVGGNNYSATINSSELIGGQNIVWNVWANDSSGFEFHNGDKTFYVRNSTFLGIVPFPADGLNGWWVTEPTFTLTQDVQTNDSINDSWYQWDADAIFMYSGPFGLEDIPNPNPISAGTLELNWWTTFGSCGNETAQSQILRIDLTNPEINDTQPADGSTVFNNPRPTISALLDEVYGSNSGINKSNVSMRLDGVLVAPNVTNASINNSLDAIVSFTPGFDLANGNHQVYVNVTDNAGRFSSKTWNFTINQTAPPNMTVYSPQNITYGTKKIPFNISLTSEVEKLEYINYNDKNPRFKILCRDCNESGYSKQKNKTLLEGENKIGIKATDFLGQTSQQNVSLFIDSKAPKIHGVVPAKNKVTNGSDFSIKYTEDNIKELLVSWNPTVNLTKQCNEGGKNVVCDFALDLSAFNGQFINYSINMTDVANRTASTKPTKVLVDTTPPVINFFNHSINGKTVEFTIQVTETNFDEINYVDLSQSNPREKKLCSSLKNGVCNKKVTFSTGAHDLVIRAVDKAGNSDTEAVSFTIV